MGIDEFSPQARDDIFERACARNATLEILTGEDEESPRYRSRLLAIDESTRPPRLIIEEPAGTGPAGPFPPDTHFEAFFMVGAQRMAFTARTGERGSYRLNEQTVVSGLYVDYPKTLFRRQRRNYYRYKFPFTHPVGVQIALERQGHRDEYFRWCQPIRDIAGGGLSFLLPDAEFGSELESGTRLDLKFSLHVPNPASKTEPIEPGLPEPETIGIDFALVGEIRMIRPTVSEGKPHTTFGLRFVEMDTPQNKALIDHLLRFVAARQREALKRDRGL